MSSLERVERSRFSAGHQRERVIEPTRLLSSMCCGERAPGSTRRIGRQRRRAFQERRGRGNAAPRLRPRGGPLEVAGDILVGHRRTLGPVPGPPIRIDARINRHGDCAMRLAPLVGSSHAVHRRAHKRMPERDRLGEDNEAFRLGSERRGLTDTEVFRGPPDERRIARWIGGREQHQATSVGRQGREPPDEALLDACVQRHRRRQPEAAGELRRRQSPGQFEQRQRVAASLDDHPIEHLPIHRRRQDGLEERPCLGPTETADGELGQTGKRCPELPRGDEEHDVLGGQSTGDDRECGRRGTIEPLRIVDHAEQGSVSRRFGKQTEDREANQEGIRRRSIREAERDFECESLRRGKALAPLEDRRA